jgi:superfamily II DNA or RNA helicase
VKINYCSAQCGSGKTYQLIEAACRIAHQGEIVVVLQPTKELIDKTIANQLLQRSNAPAHRTFYGVSPGRSVAWELTEHLKNPPDGGHIVFATHQVLPFVRFWPNQNRLHVFIDEELQIVKHCPWILKKQSRRKNHSECCERQPKLKIDHQTRPAF